MTRPVRHVRIFLLSALCCWLAGAFAASAKADGPALTAVFGIAGRYRPGAWCPVTVSIRNPASESIAGQVQVLASSDSNRGGPGQGGSRTLGAALFARPVTISANPGPQTFQLETRGLDPVRDNVTVRLAEGRERGDGRVLVQANTQDTSTASAIKGTPVGDNDPFLIGFGGDPGAFAYLSGQQLGLGHGTGNPTLAGNNGNVPSSVQVAEAAVNDLPDKAAGYGGVDAFLLRSDAPLDALTEAQADALKGWVAGGGHLIVCGGVDASRFASSFFSGLLPASVGAAHSPIILSGAGPVGTLTLTPKPLPGVRILAYAEGTPLIVTGPYGAGCVTLTAYDPTTKPFQSPAFNAVALWQNLLNGGPASSVAVLPYVAAREENYHPGYFSYGGESQLLSGAVMRGPSLDAPGTEVIGLFLLVYLIALVPANYLILKRLDRKELAWVTIPLLVLLFAAGTFGVGYAAKGGSLFINRASILETAAGRREAAVYAELGLFSPHRTSYDLTLPGANALAAIPNPGFNYGYRGGSGEDTQSYSQTKFVQTPEGASLLDTSVNMWAMRAFDSQATRDLGGTVNATLAETTGAVTGTIANHTPYAFRECVVLYHGATATLGDLGSGASLPLSMIAAPFNGRAAQGLPLPHVHNFENQNASDGDIHVRMQVALTDFVGSLGVQDNNILGNPNQAPAVYAPSSGEALLLGWSDDPALAGPRPRVDGHTVKENNVTLVIIHLPVKGAKLVAAPSSPPRFPGMTRQFRNLPRSMRVSPSARFGTLLRSSPGYKQAVDAHNSAMSPQGPGKPMRFHGVVRQVSVDALHQTLTLTFDSQPGHALTAVLHGPNYRFFPNMYALQGQEVVVSGALSQDRLTPGIELTQPSQVQIVH